MRIPMRRIAVLIAVSFLASCVFAQSNSGTIIGTVTDPSGALVSGASVSISNPVSEYARTAVTDKGGRYQFTSLPFNPYHLTVSATGFAVSARDVDVRSTVPVTLTNSLQAQLGLEHRHCRRGRGPGGKRLHLPHRRRPGPISEGPAGEPVVVTQFSGHAHLARGRRRFKRPFPRAWRPRLQLVFDRWPADYRPAEQGLLQPVSIQLNSIHRGHFWSSAGRVRRKNQSRDRGHHPVRARLNHTDRQHQHFLWSVRLGHRRHRSGLRWAELGQLL